MFHLMEFYSMFLKFYQYLDFLSFGRWHMLLPFTF